MNEYFFNEVQKLSMGGTLLAAVTSLAGGHYALRDGSNHGTKKEKARAALLRAKMKKLRKKVKVHISKETLTMPHYDSKRNRVTLRENEHPAIMAHELGHADVQKDDVGKWIQNKPTTLLAGLAPMLYRGHISDAMHKGTAASGIGAAVAVAAGVPRMLYEGDASLRGIDLMREAGAYEGELRDGKRRLAAAWSTYTADGISPALDWASLKFGPSIAKAVMGA